MSEALMELAKQFPLGEQMVKEAPVTFIRMVTEAIINLRQENDDLKDELRRWDQSGD
jgi:hypothetical protein